jgi:hypothetical protein
MYFACTHANHLWRLNNKIDHKPQAFVFTNLNNKHPMNLLITDIKRTLNDFECVPMGKRSYIG